MKDSGFGPDLEEAPRNVGTSKVRQGRFLGERIDPENMPKIHRAFLDGLIELI
jgi:hypothetical protein